MTPQDHWNQIASDPRFRSDSTRGWDFSSTARRARFTRSQVIMISMLVIGVLLIAGGFMGMME